METTRDASGARQAAASRCSSAACYLCPRAPLCPGFEAYTTLLFAASGVCACSAAAHVGRTAKQRRTGGTLAGLLFGRPASWQGGSPFGGQSRMLGGKCDAPLKPARSDGACTALLHPLTPPTPVQPGRVPGCLGPDDDYVIVQSASPQSIVELLGTEVEIVEKSELSCSLQHARHMSCSPRS